MNYNNTIRIKNNDVASICFLCAKDIAPPYAYGEDIKKKHMFSPSVGNYTLLYHGTCYNNASTPTLVDNLLNVMRDKLELTLTNERNREACIKAETENEGLHEALELLNAVWSSQNSELSKLTKENKQLKLEVAKKQDTKEPIAKSFHELLGRYDKLKTDYNTLMLDRNTRLNNLYKEIADLKKANEKLLGEYNKLQAVLAYEQEKYANYYTEFTKIKQTNEELVVELGKANDTIEKLNVHSWDSGITFFCDQQELTIQHTDDCKKLKELAAENDKLRNAVYKLRCSLDMAKLDTSENEAVNTLQSVQQQINLMYTELKYRELKYRKENVDNIISRVNVKKGVDDVCPICGANVDINLNRVSSSSTSKNMIQLKCPHCPCWYFINGAEKQYT